MKILKYHSIDGSKGEHPILCTKTNSIYSKNFPSIYHENSDVSQIFEVSRNSLFLNEGEKNKHVIDKVLLQIVDTDYTSTQTTIDPGDVVTFACFTMDLVQNMAIA